MIEPVKIADNRYAPDGATAVNMYTLNGGEAYTLGQLVAALCIKTGAIMERQSVTRMNYMNKDVALLEKGAEYTSLIAKNPASANWSEIRSFMINDLGISPSALPDSLNSYDKRVQAINAMNQELEKLTRLTQENMIEIQSLVSGRDVAYTTSTNIIRELGASSANIAKLL